MAQQFFYDGQIRRFIIQFIRLISEFQVEFGQNRAGNTTLQRVPVFYGDSSRQATYIIRGGSENTLPTVPSMAVYVNELQYDRARIQDPTFVSTMRIRQRQYNDVTQSYEQTQGDAFTVERIMPVPYKLGLKVDIWTSNTEQKLQLIEQLGVLFNPGFEIQSSDNYIDWSSLSVVYLTNVNWSSRSVPIGTENPIDIATLTFEIPIWISPPAKVKKLGIIQKIITSTQDLTDYTLLGSRQQFTPMDYGVLLLGNELTLLKQHNIAKSQGLDVDLTVVEGSVDNWTDLIGLYGKLSEGVSMIRLILNDGITEVIGTISYNTNDDTKLNFSPDLDTLPINTLSPINAIIDPRKSSIIPIIESATTGTRFLILHKIGKNNNIDGPIAWKGIDNSDLVANANDIIEFNGTHWVVSFDSQLNNNIEYVTNLNTSIQYKWNGTHWIKSWEGEYSNGNWTLIL